MTKPTCLISPQVDFWMLGGGAVLAWAILVLCGENTNVVGVGDITNNLPMTLAFGQLFVNYPHFMASYHLCYRRGLPFLRKHWMQTLAVPFLLLAIFCYIAALTTQPMEQAAAKNWLGGMVVVMYFSVGWHYSKQAFGCVMAYSNYTNYRLENIQRETLRYALLSVWWYKFASDAHGAPGALFDLTYNWPNLPRWVEPVSLYLFLGLQCWLFYRVFLVNARKGMMPHPNMIVPYLALMVWSLPQLQLNNLCFAIIPFFHSLQYLAFVYRIENSQEIRDTYHFNRQLYSSIISMALITCGWLSFLAVPGGLDAAVVCGYR